VTDHVICPACGTPNAGGDAYCGACGTALRPASVPPLACWNCRAPNPPGRAYCGQCGQPLAGPAYAAAPGEAPSRGGARNPLLIALGIVVMAFLGLAAGFLILTLADQRDAGVAGGAATAPLTPLLESAAPETVAASTPRPRRTPRPTPTSRPPAPPSLTGPVPGPPDDYTCALEPTTVQAPRDDGRYRLYEVGFQTFQSYERVVFRLRRTDADSTLPLAEARLLDSTSLDPDTLPAGVTAAVSMRLEGVSDGVGLGGYRPRGMSIVEMVTTSSGRNTTYPNVLLSSDGCYQLRVPAWETSDLGIDRDLVDVFIDFQR